ncbi:hypothetical protein F6V25_07950 [Oryzomonas japonica]|uniref:Uncharacterized protein n=1 Tax=Oryzomonas japonica TaxID=2603858 RepID=A0A7J4ZRC7_9BACT|nr:hypothetical protein [Oryzomonas japonica]KAB0665646.1 hypothetical protein F6V25_07950 [Oryzomonas japonica]
MSRNLGPVRTEIRRTFIEGQGHLVEEVAVGDPLASGQAVVQQLPSPPPVPVVLTADSVPLSLAKDVIAANGMVAVPPTFLTDEQLAELGISKDNANLPGDNESKGEKVTKLSEKQLLQAIKDAKTFDELNALTKDERRTKILSAAETRAAELKGA